MALNNLIFDDTAEFLEAYSLPTGVINSTGQWLFQNSALREYLVLLDNSCFFSLITERKQEETVKKLVMRSVIN